MWLAYSFSMSTGKQRRCRKASADARNVAANIRQITRFVQWITRGIFTFTDEEIKTAIGHVLSQCKEGRISPDAAPAIDILFCAIVPGVDRAGPKSWTVHDIIFSDVKASCRIRDAFFHEAQNEVYVHVQVLPDNARLSFNATTKVRDVLAMIALAVDQKIKFQQALDKAIAEVLKIEKQKKH